MELKRTIQKECQEFRQATITGAEKKMGKHTKGNLPQVLKSVKKTKKNI